MPLEDVAPAARHQHILRGLQKPHPVFRVVDNECNKYPVQGGGFNRKFVFLAFQNFDVAHAGRVQSPLTSFNHLVGSVQGVDLAVDQELG